MAAFNQPYLLTPITPSIPPCPPIQEPLELLPATPPEPCLVTETIDSKSVAKALFVLATERDALTRLENLYASSTAAQTSLSMAISLVLGSQAHGGKVIFVGIGKSGWVAQKLVATFNSIGIVSTFLHPSEALHGDLGMIRPHDVVIMITFSGKTVELLNVLPHIPSYIPLLVMTSHTDPRSCPIIQHPHRAQSSNVLLPTPIHATEKSTFGLSAPTTSTTVTIALGDSIALAIADRMYPRPGQGPAEVFAANHPGGAIGAANAKLSPDVQKMSDVAIRIDGIPYAQGRNGDSLTGFDVLKTAVRSPKGWVRVSETHVIAPRRCQKLAQPQTPVAELEDGEGSLVVEQTDWISVLHDCTVEECKRWIIRMREEGDGRGKQFLKPGTVLGVVDRESQKSAVIEIEDIVGEDFCGTLRSC